MEKEPGVCLTLFPFAHNHRGGYNLDQGGLQLTVYVNQIRCRRGDRYLAAVSS